MNSTFNPTSNPIGNLRPCVNCALDCAYHGDSLCVPNLVGLPYEGSPITFGLRIGLNHVFAGANLPPCVRGPMGAAYWSTQPDEGASEYESTTAKSDSDLLCPV